MLLQREKPQKGKHHQLSADSGPVVSLSDWSGDSDDSEEECADEVIDEEEAERVVKVLPKKYNTLGAALENAKRQAFKEDSHTAAF